VVFIISIKILTLAEIIGTTLVMTTSPITDITPVMVDVINSPLIIHTNIILGVILMDMMLAICPYIPSVIPGISMVSWIAMVIVMVIVMVIAMVIAVGISSIH
jgi:hypothetical protein